MGGDLFSSNKDPVDVVQEAGLTSQLVWTALNISSPLGFDPESVQLVASPRYLGRRQWWVDLQTMKRIMRYFVF